MSGPVTNPVSNSGTNPVTDPVSNSDDNLVNEDNAQLEEAQLLMQIGNQIMGKIKKKRNAIYENNETEKDMQEVDNLIDSIS